MAFEMGSVLEKIKEQEWYQQIQSGYQQLGPEQQNQLRIGGLVGAFLALFLVIYSVGGPANRVRDEYLEKQELYQIVSSANDELRRLRGQNSVGSQAMAKDWNSILSALASAQGIAPENLEIVKQEPGKSDAVIEESLLEVRIRQAALPALVRLLSQMDRGTPPMKLKGLAIEPSGTDGSLSVKLNLSGYLAKSAKGEKSK